MNPSTAPPAGLRPETPSPPTPRGCGGSDDRGRHDRRYLVLSAILLVSWTAFLLLIALRA